MVQWRPEYGYVNSEPAEVVAASTAILAEKHRSQPENIWEEARWVMKGSQSASQKIVF